MSDTIIQQDVAVTPPPYVVQQGGDGESVRGQLHADPYREYVASGRLTYYMALMQALPRLIDDLQVDFGTDIYDRMRLDAAVAADFDTIRTSVLDGGIRCAAIELQDDQQTPDDEALAQAIAQYCDAVITSLDTPIEDVAWDLLEAMADGNRIGELTYMMAYSADWDGPRIETRSIHIKDRDTVAFVVDQYNTVLGILPLRQPGRASSYAGTDGTLLLTNDSSWQDEIIPLEKFVTFSFRPKNGDPRGTSILRPAYNAWWIKQQIYPEWLKYLAQFATGMLIGTTAQGAKAKVLLGDDGLPVPDGAGGELKVTPEQVMVDTLAQMYGGAVAAFPFSSKVDVHQSTGEGRAFLAAFEQLDRWISKAITHQTLATNEGQHQARAASQVHKSIFDMLVVQISTMLARVLRRDVVWPLVKYNWGEDIANRLCPQVIIGATFPPDFTPAGVAQLESAGYFDPSHYQFVDAKLGLPPRPQDAIDALVAARHAGMQLAARGGQPTGGAAATESTLPQDTTAPGAADVTGADGQTNLSWGHWRLAADA